MALDRQSVIRTDFPMSRRGYDRIAVDRHLDEIAQQLDGIERPVSVGATTSAHVQSILDAAEASAAEIERRAWDDASRVQDDADQALAPCTRAGPGAGGCVALAARAARRPPDRGRGARGEPGRARAAHRGVRADVRPAGHDGVRPDRRGRGRRADRAARARRSRASAARSRRPTTAPGGSRRRRSPPRAWSTATTQPAGQEARESARLVALNMADGGQPREATDAYLADLYPAAERAALLDEIYRGR